MFRIASALLAALVLGACQPVISAKGPIAVEAVTVYLDPEVDSATNVGPPLQRAASRELVGHDPSGAPATVDITVTKVRYKQPGPALIYGSNNQMRSEVTVTARTGETLARFRQPTSLDDFPQGLYGYTQAERQNRAVVDQRLAEQHATDVRRAIYGNTPRASRLRNAVRPRRAGEPLS